MLYILAGLFCSALCGAALIFFANKYWQSWYYFPAAFAGLCLIIGTGIASVLFCAMSYGWFSAKYKMEIVNREYGTNYTHEEIFWASSVVETIRELDRKRYEVNGDFLRQQPDTKQGRDSRSHGKGQEN